MSVTGIYQIDTQKQMGGEYWTNRYFVEAGGFAAAIAAAEEIATLESSKSLSTVKFVSARASVPGSENDDYEVITLGFNGGVVSSDPSLPLFCVARMIFSKGPGRPDVKYFKAMVNVGGLQDPFTIKQTTVADLNATLGVGLLGVEGLCSAEGTPYTRAAVDARIGMRQLRRGSKRKEQPIIPVD